MDDTFEFVELAVDPAWQGMGIGSALHDGILTGVPESIAVLSTRAGPFPARHLYDGRGWTEVIGDFRFSPDRATAIMVLDIGAFRARFARKPGS